MAGVKVSPFPLRRVADYEVGALYFGLARAQKEDL
jgi:hypothetical protein